MKKITEKLLMIGGGTLIGLINGFFGGGGGMLCVPLLEKLLKVPTKKAHATAILIILPISIASAVIYAINGFVDVGATAISSVGVVIGGALGAVMLKRMQSAYVAITFAVIMIIAGIKLVI